VLALDEQGGRLDAGLLARALLDQADLVVMALGPTRVHARQHLRPVLALGAARAGVYLDVGVVAVGLARQQRLHLLAARLLGEFAQAALALLDGSLVALGFAQLDQGEGIVELALQPLVAVDCPVHRLALAHHLLRRLRITPEVWILGALVQLRQTVGRVVPVKDASAAAQVTGGWIRRASRLRRAWACSSMGRGGRRPTCSPLHIRNHRPS